MAIGPVFNLIFGTDAGPSNQDVIDDVNKQAEEIKAQVSAVLGEVQALSENANKYHSEEMRQLQSIDSNISTMEFRKQTDKIAEDYANVLKRINQNKNNFTCDGMGKLNNTTYKAYKEIISDPMCNISTLQVIKGINNEITSMEEHAILDFFAINVLNNMSKKVKEYEIDNNIITVNEDEAPFAKYENTASEMLQSLRTMDDIFNKVINDNNNKTFNIAPYTLTTTNLNHYTAQKGCRSFIDAWSQGIDSGCDFKISSNGRLITVTADAKKGYKLDENVKGINASGGFEVPERRKVELTLGTGCCSAGTFDSSAKRDLNTFSVSSDSNFTLTYTNVRGGCHAINVPDSAKNATVYFNRGTVYGDRDQKQPYNNRLYHLQ